MAVIQQMLPQALDPGDLTLWAQSGMIGGVGSPHASASNNVSGGDIIIAHPYTANKVMMASRNGHMPGNNTVVVQEPTQIQSGQLWQVLRMVGRIGLNQL